MWSVLQISGKNIQRFCNHVIYIIDIIYIEGIGMRILVDIGDAELKALDNMAKADKVSRASLIRKAVGDFLDRNNRQKEADAFGLWGDRAIDGLAYQDKIRSEW